MKKNVVAIARTLSAVSLRPVHVAQKSAAVHSDKKHIATISSFDQREPV